MFEEITIYICGLDYSPRPGVNVPLEMVSRRSYERLLMVYNSLKLRDDLRKSIAISSIDEEWESRVK
jgi:hypothetical protein